VTLSEPLVRPKSDAGFDADGLARLAFAIYGGPDFLELLVKRLKSRKVP